MKELIFLKLFYIIFRNSINIQDLINSIKLLWIKNITLIFTLKEIDIFFVLLSRHDDI